MIKKIMIALIFVLTAPVGECAHHYIWNNQDFAFYIDDSCILSNNEKDLVIFKLVSVNMHNNTYRITDCMFAKSSKNEWYFDLPRDKNSKRELSEYQEYWWQSYGFAWLKEHGYASE